MDDARRVDALGLADDFRRLREEFAVLGGSAWSPETAEAVLYRAVLTLQEVSEEVNRLWARQVTENRARRAATKAADEARLKRAELTAERYRREFLAAGDTKVIDAAECLRVVEAEVVPTAEVIERAR